MQLYLLLARSSSRLVLSCERDKESDIYGLELDGCEETKVRQDRRQNKRQSNGARKQNERNLWGFRLKDTHLKHFMQHTVDDFNYLSHVAVLNVF